jgi:tRNA pseudouridine55 synthase
VSAPLASAETALREDISGVCLIDKPIGPSSQQVVSAAKRLFGANKAGHGGTLDPLASGLLIVGFGEATKFLQRHLLGDKHYRATLQFGVQTATGDTEGEVVATSTVRPTETQFAHACARFVGPQQQVPPAYSALKIDGRPAYARARAGEDFVLASRQITIYTITVASFTQDTAEIDVSCSAGTYIRTLAEDLAKAVGTVAHLTALRRTGTRDLSIDRAHTLDALAALPLDQRRALLQPADMLLRDVAALQLPLATAARLSHGRACPKPSDARAGETVRVYVSDMFYGLAACDAENIRVERWMSAPCRGVSDFANLKPD